MLDLTHTLVPAIIIVVMILALEEWAYFKARTKLQRAAITGIAVFLLLLAFNMIAGPSH
jgi:hypothetical protein